MDFVLVFEINAAVAPTLSAGVRHEGGAELDMQQKVLEAVPSNRRHSEQVTFLNFADRPGVGVRSVKEHDRSGRRDGTERGGRPLDLLQGKGDVVFGRSAENALFDRSLKILAFEVRDSVCRLALELDFRLSIPAGTGKPCV